MSPPQNKNWELMIEVIDSWHIMRQVDSKSPDSLEARYIIKTLRLSLRRLWAAACGKLQSMQIGRWIPSGRLSKYEANDPVPLLVTVWSWPKKNITVSDAGEAENTWFGGCNDAQQGCTAPPIQSIVMVIIDKRTFFTF